MENKNYGINLELEKKHQKPEDWVFGALSQDCFATIPEQERDKYLPIGERQNIGEEKMDCASRGPINILETKFNYLLKNNKILPENLDWLRTTGYIKDGHVEFSDRFIAVKSGTTREGNSLIAPLEAIRKNGLIPKVLLPQVQTFNQYHDPSQILQSMNEIGQQFLERFTINYERVFNISFSTAIVKDLIDVAGFAWPIPVNGEYPVSQDQFNHCFVLTRSPRYNAFDNYIDTVDGNWVKKLNQDYLFFDYGYRVYIASQQLPIKKKTFWQKSKDFVKGFLSDYQKTFGAQRSSKWDTVKDEHLRKFPNCAVCGKDESLQVHHIRPFHLFPNLELVDDNFITLCEGTYNCHLLFGHLGNFKSYNLKVKEDASNINNKIKSRP